MNIMAYCAEDKWGEVGGGCRRLVDPQPRGWVGAMFDCIRVAKDK
jgi:hypothetical protein